MRNFPRLPFCAILGATAISPLASADSNSFEFADDSRSRLPYSNIQDRKLSLERAIQQALEASSSLRLASKQLEIDCAREGIVSSETRPKVTFNGSASRFDAASLIDFGGNSVEALGEHSEALSLTVDQKIDLLGKIRLSRSRERLQLDADRATLESIALSRTLQLKTAYFDYLRTRHQIRVAEANLNDSRAHETIARRLYENKVGQKVDLLRAETTTAQAQQSLTAAQNDSSVALATLNNLTGRTLESNILLDDVSGVGVGDDIRKTNVSIGSSPQELLPQLTLFASPAAEVDKINLEQITTEATSRRPEVIRNAALVRAGEVGVKLAEHGNDPDIHLSLSGNHYPTPSFQYVRPNTVALTLSASIPIFDGGRKREEVHEAEARRDQAGINLESSRSDIVLQVRQTYLNLRTAARQIDSVNTALVQAIAARQLAQVRYEAQVGNYVEIADAQAALVRAESNQVDAVYNYLIARAAFEIAAGIDIKHQTNTLDIPASRPSR